MASSLLFKISTIFSGAGFRAAGEGLGRLLRFTTPLIFALTKLGIRFGILQAIVGAVFGRALIRGIQASVDEATRAEAAFSRLGVQLDLLGLGSRRNISDVTKFARESASATRFAARETQEAITIALRRTGDVETALKQVAVAQDIAASTGRGLRRTTLLLNIAQAGNTRILKQITNLTNEQIRAAQRQGTLLDVLGAKFAGAASKEAQTLAGRISVLRNEQQLLSTELGAIGVPISRFVTNLGILGTRILRFATTEAKVIVGAAIDIGRRFTFIGQVSTAAAEGIGRLGQAALENSPFLRQLFGGVAQSAREAVNAITTGAKDIDRELEIRFLRAGKTRDEIREITREIARVQQDLIQVDNFGIQSLRRQQLERISNFRFAQRQLTESTKNRIETEQLDARDRRRAADARREAIAPGGEASLIARIREQAGFLQNAGLSFENAIVRARENVISLARAQVEADLINGNVADQTLAKFDRLLEGVNTIEQASARLREFGTLIGNAIPVIENAIETFRPIFQPTITLSLTPEQITQAVREGALASVQAAIARITRSSLAASREEEAQASFF